MSWGVGFNRLPCPKCTANYLIRVKDIISNVSAQFDDLRLTTGKRVFELQPDADWDKGYAINYLMDEVLEASPHTHLILYMVDDTTDEDAFQVLADDGVGVIVDNTGERKSAARYRLKDPEEVDHFLTAVFTAIEVRQDKEEWLLRYSGFDASEQGLREALTTLGNGYFCTRGACFTAKADETHYPGTYLAGGYNRVGTEIRGHFIENEDLVNLPNWLPLTFRIDEGDWFALGEMDHFDYEQILNLYDGIVLRQFRVRDADLRVTKVTERRFVHMESPHLAGIEITLTPENWNGCIEIRSSIDGAVVNDGVPCYRGLNNRHLLPCKMQQVNADTIALKTQTNQSGLEITMAARTRFFREHQTQPIAVDLRVIEETDLISHLFLLTANKGESVRVGKIVALYTSRDSAASAPVLEASNAAAEADTFDQLLSSHKCAWSYLWRRFALDLEHTDQITDISNKISMIIHLYIFHLLQTTSVNIMYPGLDVGVPSRGWHGEAYRGHIFWDELFIFPLINLRIPEITRSLLLYRYRRLPAARRAARAEGFKGAMFPWQSGSNGREESQRLHLNPRSGRWLADNSRLQRYVNIANGHLLYC